MRRVTRILALAFSLAFALLPSLSRTHPPSPSPSPFPSRSARNDLSLVRFEEIELMVRVHRQLDTNVVRHLHPLPLRFLRRHHGGVKPQALKWAAHTFACAQRRVQCANNALQALPRVKCACNASMAQGAATPCGHIARVAGAEFQGRGLDDMRHIACNAPRIRHTKS